MLICSALLHKPSSQARIIVDLEKALAVAQESRAPCALSSGHLSDLLNITREERLRATLAKAPWPDYAVRSLRSELDKRD